MREWYVIHDGKKLVSIASHDPDTDDGIKNGVDFNGAASKGLIVEKQVAGKPDQRVLKWDENITAFVDRPPNPDKIKREQLKNKLTPWNPQDEVDARRLL